MTHEHNHDLIMALAEDRLDNAAAAAAETEIAACAECAEDLRLQRIALDALQAAGPVYLTELEATRMRQAVREELGLAVAESARPKRRFSLGLALGSAAAVLLAVVVAGSVLSNFGGADDAAGTAALEATTTDAAADTTVAATTEAPALSRTGSAAESQDTTGSPTTTTATTTAAASPEDANLYAAVETEADLTFFLDQVIAVDGDETQIIELLIGRFGEATADPQPFQDCGSDFLGEFAGAVSFASLGAGTLDDQDVIVIGYVADPIEDSIVIAHDVVTCEAVASLP